MMYFKTQEEIDAAISAYTTHRSVRAAATALSCSPSTLQLLLKRHRIPPINERRRILSDFSTESISAVIEKCASLKDAAKLLDINDATLRRELQYRGIAQPVSLLGKNREGRTRPVVTLIKAILLEHGPMMDYQIAEKMSALLKKEIAIRNIADRIAYERDRRGTESFYIFKFARRKGSRTGSEGCVWAHGPGTDKERPPKPSPHERKLRIREQNKNSNSKSRMIKKILERKTPATPFDGLIYLSQRRRRPAPSRAFR